MAAVAAGVDDEYEEEKKPHAYSSYEDYLDDQVTEEDKYYLEVRARLLRVRRIRCGGMARSVAPLGQVPARHTHRMRSWPDSL